MHVEKTTYSIHDLRTGHTVALIDADGTLHDEGDPQAIAKLKALLQRDLVVRERQSGISTEDEDEGYEPFPEESMCYFGLLTLRPGDPEYLPTFFNCLSSISHYEARPVHAFRVTQGRTMPFFGEDAGTKRKIT